MVWESSLSFFQSSSSLKAKEEFTDQIYYEKKRKKNLQTCHKICGIIKYLISNMLNNKNILFQT